MLDNIVDEVRAEAAKENEDLENEKITYTGTELYNMNIEVLECLVEPIIPATGLFSIVGASDTGKSMLLRQMALSVLNEPDFLGYRINAKYKKVIVISTEDGKESISYLLHKQVKNCDGLDNIRFCFETENVPEYLEQQLEIENVDLVIIDAWGDVFAGNNQNDSSQIRLYLNQLRTIANKFECAIGILHHTGKRTEKLTPSKNNILSGQGYEAKMRLIIELRTDASDATYKHLCIVKGNYLGKDFKEKSQKLLLNGETFLFTDTGERIPFDNLATVLEDGKTARKEPLKKADEVDPITHKQIVKEIFDGNLKLKRSELAIRISNKYAVAFGTTFGGRRVEQYLDYLLNDLKIISKNGKDRSPTAYYYESC
jgi:archaellum biogenesis ATPase FlaH